LWETRETRASHYEADPRAISCPAVLDLFDHETAWGQADYVSSRSYVFSPALLTKASVWTAENSAARDDLNSHTQRHLMSSVRSPGSKIVLAETGDHHGKTGALGRGARRFNVLLADLSVRTTVADDVRRGLSFRWPSNMHGNQALIPGETTTAPGLGTEGGVRGSDF